MGYIPNDARWYLADIILEHRVEGDPRNLVNIDMHLIEAESPQQAYEKAMVLGRSSRMKYRNTEGRLVRVVFRGLRELNVIHEKLEDGAELSYQQSIGVPEEELRQWITRKRKLGVFARIQPRTEGPNTMPEEVMQMLEGMGHSRHELERHLRKRRG
jgi:hypothetical protein